METFVEKTTFNFHLFDKIRDLLLLNMLLKYFIVFAETLSLDHMRVEWVKHNSVVTQKFVNRKNISQTILSTLFNSITLIFIITA